MSDQIQDPKLLGQMVRDTRKEQGLSQDDLAGLSGTGRRFVSELENGKDTAHLGKTLTVLAALGLGIYALSKWKD